MHACVPNATATPPPRVQSLLVQRRPLRVYVFNSSLNCTNERNGKDRYEWLTGRLVPIHMRVSEPGDADLLYHPACLVNAFCWSCQAGGAEAPEAVRADRLEQAECVA